MRYLNLSIKHFFSFVSFYRFCSAVLYALSHSILRYSILHCSVLFLFQYKFGVIRANLFFFFFEITVFKNIGMWAWFRNQPLIGQSPTEL